MACLRLTSRTRAQKGVKKEKSAAPKKTSAAPTALKRAPAVGAEDLAKMVAEHLVKILNPAQASAAAATPVEAK